MELKRSRSYKKKRSELVVTLFLTACFCCAPTFAETNFSYAPITTTASNKLINPMYLDKTKTQKPTIKTTVPYKGTFNESDYFSSDIDEIPQTPPPPKTSPEATNIDIINTYFIQEKAPQNSEHEMKPIPANNFFAPPIESVKNTLEPPTTVIEEINASFNTPTEIVTPPANELVSIQEEETTNKSEEIDIEGRTISKITIAGLKIVSPRSVKKYITTKEGSLFSTLMLQEDLQKMYATGYFTDEMSIEPEINSDGTISIIFTLEENVPVRNIKINGNTVISTAELMPIVSKLNNLPQNIENINKSIENINNYYHDKGYILANVNSIDDTSDGTLIFNIQEGVISQISIEGNEKTKDYVIQRNIMTQPNTVYNENYLKDDLARIYSTKIFKEVDREVTPSMLEEGKFDLKVKVKEDSPNALSLGGGVDNGLGAFGSVGFTENNLRGRGQRLSLSGILGSGILLSDASIKNRMNYQVELSFFEPYFINSDNSLMSKLYFRDYGSWQVPLAIEQRIGLNTTVEHKVRGYKHLTTSFGAGFENINVKEGDFNRISEMYAYRNLDIKNRAKELTDGFFVNLSPGIKYSTLDSEEIPRSGIIANAKFIEAISLTDIKNTNGRLAGGVTKYFPVREKSSFSLSAKGGIKVHGDDMPEVMAFRLGGPYSVRGFRMSGVGTGDAFVMGSAELATPLPFVDRMKWDFLQKIRLTFFVDAGQIFDETTSSLLYDRPLSAITAGVGLKMYIPGVGPMSVDYGIPLTNPGDFGSKHGYFTFGSSGMSNYNY